jgi:hypothetical protein
MSPMRLNLKTGKWVLFLAAVLALGLTPGEVVSSPIEPSKAKADKPVPDSMIHAQIWIEGNSSLQRFYLNVEGISVQSDLNTGSTVKTLLAVILNRQGHRLVVTLPVNSLKSGDSNMDSIAHDKLKSKAFPDIVFTLGDYVIKAFPGSLSAYALLVSGQLKIAGVEKAVVLEPTLVLTRDGIKLYGSQDVSQKDYGIAPYSAAVVMTTDDKIVVHYMITLGMK